MKKVKYMLLGTITIAFVGGALSFNWRGSAIYCADLSHVGAIAGSPDCPLFLNSTYVLGAPAISFCTITEGTPCGVQVRARLVKQ